MMNNYELALVVLAGVGYFLGIFTREVLGFYYRSSGARNAVRDLKRKLKDAEPQSKRKDDAQP
jgi:hypothetical protein